jgi:toxin ParE1/3/4
MSRKRAVIFDIAFRQVDVFLQRFEFLSTHPYAGRARDELQPGLRSFPVGQYVIFYRVVSSDALILRVMHGRRDIDATFQQ